MDSHTPHWYDQGGYLPEITEVQRFRYAPGDRFILKASAGTRIDMADAGAIARRFRAAAGLPDGAPVVILTDDWEVTIAGPENGTTE